MIRISKAAGAFLIGSLAFVALPGAADADTVAYSCQGGAGFNATFDNSADTLTLELQGGARVILNEAVSGSGFRYTGGGYEFHGKGRTGNFISPGQHSVSCQETGRINNSAPSAPVFQPPAPQAVRPRTQSPSFNCNVRLNPTELRICSNPELAGLDRSMAEVYRWLSAQLSAHKLHELKNDQKNWLSVRNRCGTNDSCIRSEILDRTAYLNEYFEPGSPPPAQTRAVSFPFPAQSWGGKVRSGPGQNYRKAASLREGEPITILEQTGQYFQDLPWFKIRYRGHIGYHWGGIICPKGRVVPGTFQVCH